MTKILTNRGWLAAFAAAILCLAAFGYASTAHAAVSSFKVGSATTGPDTDVTINVTLSGDAVGALGVNVAYDATKVTPTSCTSAFGVCNVASPTATNAVYINGSSLTGIGGTDVVVGTITFHAGSTLGTAALTATVTSLADTDGNDLTVTPTNGAITIAAETATASPSPAPSGSASASASPTKTPAGLPQTGGTPAGDSFELGWLAAAAGLVIVAAGAWTFARAREDS